MSTTARTTHRRTRGAGLAGLAGTALIAGLALAGCGADDASGPTGSAEDHNDADVAFATGMIPHHAQALTMVEMTEGRRLDPEVERLTRDIEAAQAPEIETMSGWLEAWGEDVPDGSGMGMGGGDTGMEGTEGMDGMEMGGMMSGADMRRLDGAPDRRFQDMWLRMMVEHHEGAVEMAEAEQQQGEYAPAIELAEEIAASQTEEIRLMEDLLRR